MPVLMWLQIILFVMFIFRAIDIWALWVKNEISGYVFMFIILYMMTLIGGHFSMIVMLHHPRIQVKE